MTQNPSASATIPQTTLTVQQAIALSIASNDPETANQVKAALKKLVERTADSEGLTVNLNKVKISILSQVSD